MRFKWETACKTSSQCLVLSECIRAQLCPTNCNPMGCSPPGFSVHEISRARILEWVAISSSTGSSPPRNRTVSCISSIVMKDSINARNCYQPHYFTAVIPIAATSITVTKGENKAKKTLQHHREVSSPWLLPGKFFFLYTGNCNSIWKNKPPANPNYSLLLSPWSEITETETHN